jgi:uncharacterized membrane protein YhaH (DUF805 family)
MNDIIILMWLGDITRNLDFALSIFMVVYCLAGVIVLICLCAAQCSDDFNKQDKRENLLFTKLFARSSYWAVPVILLGLALPSKDTVRLAVAFKAGAVITATPLGQKATEAASAVLDRIIKEAGGTK